MSIIKERTSFLDKALLQALLYSLLIHLVLFGSFRIRLNDFQDSTPQMLPIDVAIDADKIDAIQTETNALDLQQIDSKSLFISNLDPDEYRAINLALVSQPADSTEDMLDRTSKLAWTPRMYPLQLKLSPQLKALELTDDGSSLFREKGPYDSIGRFALAPNHLPIEYKVRINGMTGCVEGAEKDQVLLDKRLQSVADLIISHIRFKPFSEKQIAGRITLIFCCSGDEIKSLMND